METSHRFNHAKKGTNRKSKQSVACKTPRRCRAPDFATHWCRSSVVVGNRKFPGSSNRTGNRLGKALATRGGEAREAIARMCPPDIADSQPAEAVRRISVQPVRTSSAAQRKRTSNGPPLRIRRLIYYGSFIRRESALSFSILTLSISHNQSQ